MFKKYSQDNESFIAPSSRHLRLALADLIFKSYRRSFQFIFFGFAQPVVIFTIFYFLFTLVLKNSPSSILPGYILLAPLSTALMAFNNMLSRWKASVLLKRISITPLSNFQFMLTFIGFYFIVSLIASFWMMAWGALFISVHLVKMNGISYTVSYVFSHLRWEWLLLALVQLIFIANCIAVLLAGLVTGINRAQGLTMAVFFPSIFIGGFIFSGNQIEKIPILKWISYFIPFKMATTLSLKAWGGHIPNSTLSSNIWIPIIVGFLWAFLFLGIALKTFKWNNK